MSLAGKKQHSFWFIISGDNTVLVTHNLKLPHYDDIAATKLIFIRTFLLGQANNVTYYGAEIDACSLIGTEKFVKLTLRQALLTLPPEKFSLFVSAYAIVRWDKNHQYCGRCGQSTQHQKKNFERICIHCKLSFFPRISPCIIVRIRKKNQLLMARSPYFPSGAWGLIAGFVDVGETLEHAVHREVREEVGITIKNLSYFGSQPWPFPDSLMIAFTADHCSGKISIDNKEIIEADWYNYNDLPGRPSTPISIASLLIDDFIKKIENN